MLRMEGKGTRGRKNLGSVDWTFVGPVASRTATTTTLRIPVMPLVTSSEKLS